MLKVFYFAQITKLPFNRNAFTSIHPVFTTLPKNKIKLKSSSPQGSSKCQRLYCLGDKTQNTQSKQLLLTTHQAGSLAPTNPPKSPKQHTCLSPSELCTGLHSSIVLLLFAEKTLLEDRFSSIPSRKSPITNKRWAVHTGSCLVLCMHHRQVAQ